MNGDQADLPGLGIFRDAMMRIGSEADTFAKSPFVTEQEAEASRRKRLHDAAVKHRRKRKRGGPK